VAVGALEPQFWAELLDGLKLPEGELPDRWDRTRWPELRAVLADRLSRRSRHEWAEQFVGTDACLTPVLTFSEAARHPTARARGSFLTVDGVEQPAPAPRFSRHSGRSCTAARQISVDEVLTRWRPQP